MKTLIHNETKQSKYIWLDDAIVLVSAEMTISPTFNISDLNSANATLIENVNPPEDWIGCKYLYDDGWTLNPDWIDPKTL